jgi:arylsulfatase A-like enzyme
MSSLARRQLLLAAPALLRARARRPNVLWLMTDEQRPDSLRCYNSPWAYSPNLDRLAESGVLFESAYTPSPVCVPARCALLTGDYGSTTGVLHNQAKLPAGTRLLTWEFERAGYQSASFGKKHYSLAGPHQAFETEQGRATDKVVGPEAYGKGYDPNRYDVVQYPNAPTDRIRRRWILAGKFPAPISETAEDQNVNLAIRWLEQRDAAKPFLLRLSLNAPHTPVVVPEQFLSRINPRSIDLPAASERALASAPARVRVLLRDFEGAQRLTAAELEKARHYYYARAAFADYEIGRLLDWIRARGLLDDTIVAMTADHGNDLGDHGLLQKQSFYEQVATVPYIFAWRGLARRGARIATPVNTISLMPTVMRFAGIPCPDVEAAPVLDPAPPRGPVFSEIEYGYQKYRDDQRQVMVRDGRFKMSLFIKRGDPGAYAGSPDGELYDLERDPLERVNLFAQPPYAQTVSRLKSRIVEWDRRRGKAGKHS